MHYFKRNIGDYHKKAGRLSMLEHGAYTLLIDSCYDREQFPTLEEAIDWTWARTEDEIAAVKFVLSKFFVLDDGVYVQKRIKEEIEAFHKKAETNARIAKDREENRRKIKQNVHDQEQTVHEPCSSGDEAPPNHKPITNNHNKDICANGFARFWDVYPKKKSKGIAEKAFLKIKPSEQLLETMLESIERAKTSDDWRKDSGQFIPYPATWLNAKGWEDDAGSLPAGQDSIFAGAI